MNEKLEFDQEDLKNQVIKVTSERLFDELINGDVDSGLESEFTDKIRKRIKDAVNKKIDALADKNIIPRLDQLIEELVLTPTNQWGEKNEDGDPKTFKEYLVQRAGDYMKDEVDSEGKTKKEGGSYWTKNSSRLNYMIEERFDGHMKDAVKTILENATELLTTSIREAVEGKLKEIAAAIKIKVSDRR